MRLQDDVSKIKGIGAKKKERLRTLGIHTVGDLIDHLPVRYRDRQTVTLSLQLEENRDQLACGRLLRKQVRPMGGRRTMLICTLTDYQRPEDDDFAHPEWTLREEKRHEFQAVFFNMPFLSNTLVIGKEYTVFGKCKRQRGIVSFSSPEICEKGSARDVRGILPVYRCTSGITTLDFTKWIQIALDEIEWGDDWMHPEIVDSRKLCGEEFAYRNLHFPEDRRKYKVARFRYIYEQLFIYMMITKWTRENIRNSKQNAAVPPYDLEEFLEVLPFTLTSGQQEALSDINADLDTEQAMNRLVQGDVGCGKTVVAEAAIFRVAKSGMQSVFMAPTEILARQHYQKLDADLRKLGIRCVLLISALKASEKRACLEQIASGEADVVIGTHAVLQDNVEFRNLALVVTDEQHRFGVNQRKTLVEKAVAPNVLVMSATPIPRTLQATVFGDMDFSIIRNRPKSRKKVITRAVDQNGRTKAYSEVRKEIEMGHRAYVVAPSIEDDEEGELASVEKLYEEIRKKFKGFQVTMLHGKMRADEKDRIMSDFAAGKIDILVATVVIEVGIDVPEATVIVIENCDRFGLAQLHQLRGRVGRSERQSYCWLINYSKSEVAKERVKIMTTTDDGFEISEEDYRLRGPGDLRGTMQHGAGGADMALFAHTLILEQAREDVYRYDISYEDPEIKRRMESIFQIDNSDII